MTKPDTLKRIIEVHAELEKSKALYKEMEELIDMLVKDVGVDRLQYQDNYIQVVDNFADKNTMWKATAFRRFDVKITKA